MDQRWGGWYWHLGLASLLAMGGALAFGGGLSPIALSGNCALGQIIPDGTLGAESSVVTRTNIDSLPTERMDGGATRGANLFHSFEQFSVPTGGAAHFNNALDIQNIISRVTGGSVSNIDGLIQANASANLFLINPNGIIFGPNASLDIGGSFVGSTASSLNFADGTQFSATAAQNTPLLTVSVPIGLQYGGTAGSIVNQSRATNSSGEVVGLQVQPGKTLALVGGDVRLEGGRLQTLGGRLELGGAAGSGSVGLSMNGSQWSLSFPDDVDRADVYLTNLGSNTARINVAASNGGSIAITARNIDIVAGGSVLRGGLETGLGFPGAEAGDIELSATGAINVANGLISNNVRTGSVGNSGNIDITAGSLSVTNGAQLQAVTIGQGDAGSVRITARDQVSFDGVRINRFPSGAFSGVEAAVVGNSGDINIKAGSLSLTNGAQLQAGTSGQGDGGSVRITARDTVSFDGVGSNGLPSGASSEVSETAVGNGGGIDIKAGSLALTNGAEITANTFGQGDAGSVIINARDTVSFDGVGSNGFTSAAFSGVADTAVGNGGGIDITTGSLALTNGAEITASTSGQGDGGSITLNANTLEAVNGGQFVTTSFTSGKAGNITLNVTDSVTLAGSDRTYLDRLAQFGEDAVSGAGSASGVFANTSKNSTGQGGDLRITTGQLIVRDGAQVAVSSQGSGGAGNLETTARSIRLEARAALNAGTTAGQGNIFLRSRDLVLRRGSNITTNATGTATGGNITIDTDILAASENSDITANAQDARGGWVIINAQGIFRTGGSDITASSNLGPEFSGTVEFNTPDVDPVQGLATLPAELVEASRLIATGCAAVGENEFIVTGRGGIPPSPNDTLSSDTVWTDLRTFTEQAEARLFSEEATQETNPATEHLVEAQGWVINDKGEVVLTATAPNVTPNIPWLTPANCHSSTSHEQHLALDAR